MIHHHRIAIGWKSFYKHIGLLLKNPIFIVLTIVGNVWVVSVATLFYWIEYPQNPNLHSYLDAIWWAVTTVTTVGYGTIVPLTTAGKIVDIFLMISGTVLFLSYIALFSNALVGPAVEEVENEIDRLEKEVKKLEDEIEGKV